MDPHWSSQYLRSDAHHRQHLTSQVWLDELWFAAPKLRDNSLDIDSFCKQAMWAAMGCRHGHPNGACRETCLHLWKTPILIGSGWCFGTMEFFMTFHIYHILGMSSSQLTFIFFRGVAKNHQPDWACVSQLETPETCRILRGLSGAGFLEIRRWMGSCPCSIHWRKNANKADCILSPHILNIWNLYIHTYNDIHNNIWILNTVYIYIWLYTYIYICMYTHITCI